MTVSKARSHWHSNLYTIPIILTLVGIYFVFESSSIRAMQDYSDPYFFVRKQLIWFGLGLVAMTILSNISYKRLVILALPSIITSIILLIAVLIPGIGSKVNGARRWIDVGIIPFQPAELVKASIILYLAAWFQFREKKRVYAFAILLLFLMALIMAQPDMGTAMIIGAISVGMYFVAGVELRQLFMLVPAFAVLAVITAQSAAYRVQRLISLFNVNHDPNGMGYHVRQIMIAFQNGGLLGVGFGASRQKFLYLPEAHTDSIFAIFVEEVGFIGACALIALYALFLYYLYRMVVQTHERFGFMLGSGILLFFGLQSLINFASMTQLAPLTGVPLPLISYGGTNLFISFCLIGIARNIAQQQSTHEPVLVSRLARWGSALGAFLPLSKERKIRVRNRKSQ